ncbi:hypothetical protein COU57_04700 [Candidatus Pacearchaeota archaeon CG10_big_fil_rev_8_21_14_0_10_32_14]|nr:MAG: hypothetical protein COU57_04700 [Candidatus Pacearchaeota archaeon CG10_big_fil_rev_8_21_14_0_10_32_14]
MESISLKLDKEFLKDIEIIMKKNRYSTKTEFIREAVRDKIKELEKNEVLKKVDSLFGSSKKNISDEKLHAVRKELEGLYEKKFR